MTSDKAMVEEMARAIYESIWPDEFNAPKGSAEHAQYIQAAQAAATIAQRRVEEAYRDWFDKGHAVGFREGARAALNPKGE